MHKRFSVITASALFIGAAACSRTSPSADPSLAADLKAASGSSGDIGNPNQIVVSPLEGGPQSAPQKAAPKRVYKPAPRAETRVASTPQPTATAAPEQPPTVQPTVQQPASQPTPTPAEAAPAPASRPQPVQQQRQQGTYSTEAEIFRKMPWIRP